MNAGLHAKVTNFDNEVVSMKLLTADRRVIELIARVISSTETSRWVMNPQLLQAMQVKNPQTGATEEVVGMINFMVSGDQTKPVEIERIHILSTSLTAKEAKDEYVRLTSPILTPKAPGLIT